jgi:hypothetical protein
MPCTCTCRLTAGAGAGHIARRQAVAHRQHHGIGHGGLSAPSALPCSRWSPSHSCHLPATCRRPRGHAPPAGIGAVTLGASRSGAGSLPSSSAWRWPPVAPAGRPAAGAAASHGAGRHGAAVRRRPGHRRPGCCLDTVKPPAEDRRPVAAPQRQARLAARARCCRVESTSSASAARLVPTWLMICCGSLRSAAKAGLCAALGSPVRRSTRVSRPCSPGRGFGALPDRFAADLIKPGDGFGCASAAAPTPGR